MLLEIDWHDVTWKGDKCTQGPAVKFQGPINGVKKIGLAGAYKNPVVDAKMAIVRMRPIVLVTLLWL